ncbi:RNA polymerase factor sigma-54 [Caproiciproducens sp. R2]|uniref:RNA polymerase factor sigma-54 n=1 Tax=Caproiciproducens sp. R2 TaxID=3435187 RepID=UPI004033F3E0
MELLYVKNQTQRQSQSQKLKLTAEMRESLALLQMPLVELQQRVEEAVMENPVLEYDGDDSQEDPMFSDCALGDDGESYQDTETALEIVKMLSLDSCAPGARQPFYGDQENFNPYATLSAEDTFTDCLLRQLGERKVDRTIGRICSYIIQDLTEKGYLGSSVEELSRHFGLPVEKIKEAVKIIQTMQPPGVGAANITECLLLQLGRCTECDAAMVKEIIEKYLGLLSENKIQVIANRLGISLQAAEKMCDFIRGLNPIPSRGFQTDRSGGYVIPEAAICKDGQGGFFIRNNEKAFPHLRISEFYQKLLLEENDRETLLYLKDKTKQASFLIKQLSSRKSTVLRVLEKIVELQKDYFEHGVSCLKPMSIAEVADRLHLHQSTVSRAISGKYVVCSSGTVSIKSLFTSKIRSRGKEDCFSSLQIKETIRSLIEHENKSAPLSDQKITRSLQEKGIDISRRTVAKYRYEMEIPAAEKRKMYQ